MKISKVIITMGTTYCGCPSESIEFEYYGTEKEFNFDNKISTKILNMILNGDFPHYFMDIDFEEEDVCEWKCYDSFEFAKSNCGSMDTHRIDFRKLKYCPYCGKKIRVVE